MSLAKEASEKVAGLPQAIEQRGAAKAVKSLQARLKRPGGTDPDKIKGLLKGSLRNLQQ